MRALGLAGATALLLLVSYVPGAEAQARKPALAWHCPEFTALLYTGGRTNDDAGRYRFAKSHLVLRPHLSATGECAAAPGELKVTEIVFRVASVLGRGKAWTSEVVITQRELVQATDGPVAFFDMPEMLLVDYTRLSEEDGVARIKAVGKQPPAPDEKDELGRTPPQSQLELSIEFDTAAGWLKSVSGTWSGTAFTPPAEFSYTLTKHLSFDSRDALNRAINSAIERGRASVARSEDDWQRRDYASLAAFTLLHAGMAADDPATARALERMTPQPGQTFIQNYHAAFAILALEAKYVSEAEKRDLAAGRTPAKCERPLSDADRKTMTEAVDYIARCKVELKTGSWAYNTESKQSNGDLSNTQMAALALQAAARCGVAIPEGVVRDTVKGMADYRVADGPEVRRVLSKGSRGFVRSRNADKARGFTYSPVWESLGRPIQGRATGSMTCAGVCTLLAMLDIHDGWTDARKKAEFGSEPKTWLADTHAMINGGPAWLDHYYTLAENLNASSTVRNYYYYLYSLERVGAMAKVEYIGEHHWYTEGATLLLMNQQDDGSWANIEDTCFALLFLSRATIPTRKVYTGK